VSFFKRYKLIILYGVSLAVLTLLLRWLEFRFVVIDHALDIYIGIIAVFFTALGIWLALKLTKPKVKTIIVEKKVLVEAPGEFIFNEAEFRALGLSNRELEVLQLMSQGLSNQEIAEKLFVSLNTVKTHSSGLFSKLDVKRRTQAVEVGKRLKIIP